MKRRGYCIYISTICEGSVPSVLESPTEDKIGGVCIFETQREAELEIVDFMETRLQQFKDGERDFDDAITVEEYVVEVEILPDGRVVEVR